MAIVNCICGDPPDTGDKVSALVWAVTALKEREEREAKEIRFFAPQTLHQINNQTMSSAQTKQEEADAEYARQLAKEEASQPPPPFYEPPAYSNQYQPEYKPPQQHQQQQLPIVIGSNGLPMVPVIVNPDGRTANITNHSFTVSQQAVPLGQALATHSYSGGVRVDEPYNSNGYWGPERNDVQVPPKKKWYQW
ncbi:hypothetical protein BCR33DRAFT_713740 [Rhizoclosmatium globosum]|uniref:Uncharacterized protein n=1 Tax=Rhizoclosmatium globosum TaxID=329046 RepID=A0A1Y2CSQ0_9FUNG|nr:hypothetical protein BCR33DRAFT_713740 [Rhizoclosmatium globosum]|eukprot:ORY49405.1 hypothetical protein BCR33DRAFT_713740 [Rhizoclosmatium globosum]